MISRERIGRIHSPRQRSASTALSKRSHELARAAKERNAERNSDVGDIVDDLCELKHLLDDLSSTPGLAAEESAFDDIPFSDKPFNEFNNSFARSIRILKSRLRRNFDLVERVTRWADSNELSSLLASIRKDYISIKSALRVAYRQRGTMLCANDWQSPIYDSSTPFSMNRLAEGIAEHVLDYKRDGHLDAADYEAKFLQEYASHLGSGNLRAYLTNCGMAAFSTVLHWLASEEQLGESAVAFTPMYFENIHLARNFFPGLVQVDSRSSETILSTLRANKPSVVLIDAVANCAEVLLHDINTVLKWAAVEADPNREVAVVIDSTCLPTVLLEANLLKGLPSNVLVLFLESLAKHHQFGMDTVTGGVLIAHMDKTQHTSFSKTRARLGTNIADTSVGSLPKPHRQLLSRRMYRHSRNMQLLADGMKGSERTESGIIESISMMEEGTKTVPWFRSSVLSIRLRKPFRTIAKYKQFEKTVLAVCAERKHPVALSTSFGFDVSRLYVTAPNTKFEDPFLRLAMGTETFSEMATFLDIVAEVDAELALSWNREIAKELAEQEAARQMRELPGANSYSSTPTATNCTATNPAITVQTAAATTVEALAKSVENVTRFPASPAERGRNEAVYSGENSLKDYLNPASYPATPLVELPADLNPFDADGVRIYAKMMPAVPLMNIKSLPAYSMISKAFERGDLEGVENLIESSSSNTVMSLSIIGKLFGINNTYALVDDGIAPGLLKMLRLFGVEPRLHPGPKHPLYGKMRPRSERAKFSGSQDGWMNPGQYDNPDNPEGFGRWLAPDLWAQTQGKLDVLSCGLGTCGTIVGITTELRRRKESLQVVACTPAAGDAVPGPREQAQLWDVAFDWQNIANARMDMPATDSFEGSVALLRRGIMCGPSSGMNYAGLLRYLEQEKDSGRLAEKVASQGEVVCVFMCCDSPLQHVEDYYRVLGEEFFPAVQQVPEIDPVTGEDFSKAAVELDFTPEEPAAQRLGTVIPQEAVVIPPTAATPVIGQ